MRNQRDSKKWRAELWKLAEQTEITAQYIRYADKFADLTLPLIQLLQMVQRIRLLRNKWLHQTLDLRSAHLKSWPKLFERYL